MSSSPTGSFQCVVCEEYFERKEFFKHTKEHPQGMQYSSKYRDLVENKLKKDKEEKWTFFDDSIPEHQRTALDPPVSKSKKHPLELTEEDRLFSRVSDWHEKFKQYEREKKRRLREEQWKHMSRPLSRSLAQEGESTPVSSTGTSVFSSPTARASLTASTTFSVHGARSAHQDATNSPRGVPQTNGKQWLQHKRNQQQLQQTESKYRCKAFPLQHLGDPEHCFSGTTFRGDSVVLLRKRDLMFVKHEKVAFIPLPPLSRFHKKNIRGERPSSATPKTSIPPMSHIVYAEGGNFYLWNGYIGDKAYFLRFNILLNEWTKVGPIPMPTSMNLHAVRGTRLLYHRGYNAILMIMGSLRGIVAGLSNSVYIYYLDSSEGRRRKWIQIQPSNESKRSIPSRRANHSAVLYKENNIVVFGGETKTKSGDVALTNDCWIFSIVQNSWSRLLTTGVTPPPCAFHAACCSGKFMFVSGGKPLSNQLYFLNLETRHWNRARVVEPVPRARFNHHLLPVMSPYTSALSFIFTGGTTEGGGEGEKPLFDAHILMIQKLRSTTPTLFEKRSDIDAFCDVNVVAKEATNTPASHGKVQSIFDDNCAHNTSSVLSKQIFDGASVIRKEPQRSRTPDAFVFENGSLLVSPHDLSSPMQHHPTGTQSVPHSRAASRPASPSNTARRRPSSATQRKSTRISHIDVRASTSMSSTQRKRPTSARRSSDAQGRMDLTRSVYELNNTRRNSTGRRRREDLYSPKRSFVAVKNLDTPPTRRTSEGVLYSPSSSRPSSGKRKSTSQNVDLNGHEDLLNGDPGRIQLFLEARISAVRDVLVDRKKKQIRRETKPNNWI